MIDQTMEVILTRDQRTTSHRVLDRTVQSYALNSTSTLPPKYQDDIVANNRNIEAITKTAGNNCDKRHLPYNSHLMPAFYDDRKVQKIRIASVTFVRMLSTWLSKSKCHHTYHGASLALMIIYMKKNHCYKNN